MINLQKNKFGNISKVKHPYKKLINGVLLGAVMMLTSILSVGTGLFGSVFGVYAYYTGDGTSSSPYVINSASDFNNDSIKKAMSRNDAYFELGANLNLNNTVAFNDNFKANFNGRGFTITSNTFFVYNNYGVIANTKFAYGDKATYTDLAKVVNHENHGTIRNVEIVSTKTSQVVNSKSFGSVVSYNYGQIEKVVNNQSYVNNHHGATNGGISAYNYSVITNAVNKGGVSGSFAYTNNLNKQYSGAIGGIVGQNYFNSAYVNAITDSYNDAKIVGGNGASLSVVYDGAHAGGIVGANNFANNYGGLILNNKELYETMAGESVSRTTYIFRNLINYGEVVGGNGSLGMSGLGGTYTNGFGGIGGNGGGAGGNASGIIGISTNSNIIFKNNYNFGKLTAGNGGNGGAGGGGLSAFAFDGNDIDSALKNAGSKGSADGKVGGTGGKSVGTYTANTGTLYYGSGGGAGGAGGYAGIVNAEIGASYSNRGGNGGNGGKGTILAGGNGGVAGKGFKNGGTGLDAKSIQTTQINGKAKLVETVSGGSGGIGGLGETAKSLNGANAPLLKTSYQNFDFTSDNGWVMGAKGPVLRSENVEKYVSIKIKVLYNGVDKTNTSSTYFNLSNLMNGSVRTLSNGTWSIQNSVLGGNDSLWVGENSEFTLTNNLGYMFEVSGAGINYKPTSQDVKKDVSQIKLKFNEDDQRSNSSQPLVVTINVMDKLEGEGTIYNPYLIRDFKDFASVSLYDDANVYFKQVSNITETLISSVNYAIEDFKGIYIGSGYTITRNGSFAGALFKNNYGTISGLNVNYTTSNINSKQNNFGLLVETNTTTGIIKNVNIKSLSIINLVVENANIDSVGGVAGVNNGKIINAHNYAGLNIKLVTGKREFYIGGIAGYNSGAIQYASSNSKIDVSGIDKYALTTNIYLGGIVGKNDTNSEINNSYSVANIVASTHSNVTDYIGGISGINLGEIEFVYANVVKANALHNFGISNEYSSATSYSDISTGLKAGDFNEWNANIWSFDAVENNGLPMIKAESNKVLESDLNSLGANANSVAKLKALKVVNIENATQLNTILNYINDFSKDTNNSTNQVKTINILNTIDYKGTSIYFTSIPSNIVVEGNGNKIINNKVSINVSQNEYFATIFNKNDGLIKNLNFSDSVISVDTDSYSFNNNANLYVGLIATNNGGIENVGAYIDYDLNILKHDLNIVFGSIASASNGVYSSIYESYLKISGVIFDGVVDINSISSNLVVGGLVGKTSGLASITNSTIGGKININANNINKTHSITFGGIVGVVTYQQITSNVALLENINLVSEINVSGLNNSYSPVVVLIADMTKATSTPKIYNLLLAPTTNSKMVVAKVASASSILLNSSYVDTTIVDSAMLNINFATQTQLKNSSTYSNWNFDGVWLHKQNALPVLWNTQDSRQVSLKIEADDVKAYVNSYLSSGKTTKSFSASANLFVIENDNVIVGGIDEIGNLKIVSSHSYNKLVVKINGEYADGYDIENANSSTFFINIENGSGAYEIEVSTHYVYSAIEFTLNNIEQYNNNLEIYNYTTNSKVVLDGTSLSKTFAYEQFSAGDKLRVWFNHKGDDNYNYLTPVKVLNDYIAGYTKTYLEGFKVNNKVVDVYTDNESEMYFDLVVTDEMFDENNLIYITSVTAVLNEIIFTASENLSQFTVLDEDIKSISMIVPSLNKTKIYENVLFAYVKPGEEVNVFAPEMIKSSNNYEFKISSVSTNSGVALEYVGSPNNYTKLMMPNRDIDLKINYIEYSKSIAIRTTVNGIYEDNFGILYRDNVFVNEVNTFFISRTNNSDKLVMVTSNPYNDDLIKKSENEIYLFDASSSTKGIFDIYGYYFNGQEVVKDKDGYFHKGIEYTLLALDLDKIIEFEGDVLLNAVSVTPPALANVVLNGEGTSLNPYIIDSLEAFNTLSAAFSVNLPSPYKGGKHFKLNSNIEMTTSFIGISGVEYNFTPIGSKSVPFDGHLDGDYKFINNLYINNTENNYVGLFGYVSSSATIKNITFVNPNIVSTKVASNNISVSNGVDYSELFIGVLAGENLGDVKGVGVTYKDTTLNNATIINSYNSNDNTNSFVGGLIGKNSGNIEFSFVQGTLKGDSFVGGLVGISTEGNIYSSYSNVNVYGKYVGGLVARNGSGIATNNSNFIVGSYTYLQMNIITGSEVYANIAINYINAVNEVNVLFENTYSLIYDYDVYINYSGNLFGMKGNVKNNIAYYSDYRTTLAKFISSSKESAFALYDTNLNTFNGNSQNNLGYPMLLHTNEFNTIKQSVYLDGQLYEGFELQTADEGLNYQAWLIYNYFENSIKIAKGLPLRLFAGKLLNSNSGYYISKITKVSTTNEITVLYSDVVNTLDVYVNDLKNNEEIKIYFESINVKVLHDSNVFKYINTYNDLSLDYNKSRKFNIYTKSIYTTIDKVEIFNGQEYVALNISEITTTPKTSNVVVNGKVVTITYSIEAYSVDSVTYLFEVVNGGVSALMRIIPSVKIEVFMENAVKENKIVVNQFKNGVKTLFGNYNQESNNIVMPVGYYNENGQFEFYGYNMIAESFGNSQIDYAYNFDTKIYDYNNRVGDINNNVNINIDISKIGYGRYDSFDNYIYRFTFGVARAKFFIETDYDLNNTIDQFADFSITITDTVDGTVTNQNTDNKYNSNYNGFGWEVELLGNSKPNITINNATSVEGYENVFMYNNKYYRLIWLQTSSKDNSILDLTEDMDLQFNNSYKFENVIEKHNILVMYIVDMYEVDLDTQLHDSSWYTSLSTDKDHRPEATIKKITPYQLNNIQLPGVTTDINTRFIDAKSSVEFASSTDNLTDKSDIGRYTFLNWNNIQDIFYTDQNSFVVSEMNKTMSIRAYYEITLVSIALRVNITDAQIEGDFDLIDKINVKLVNPITNTVIDYKDGAGNAITGNYLREKAYPYKAITLSNGLNENYAFTNIDGKLKKSVSVFVSMSGLFVVGMDNARTVVAHWRVPYGEKVVFELPDTKSTPNTTKNFNQYIDEYYVYNIDKTSENYSSNFIGDVVPGQSSNYQAVSDYDINYKNNNYTTNNNGEIIKDSIIDGIVFETYDAIYVSVLYKTTKIVSNVTGQIVSNDGVDRTQTVYNRLKIELDYENGTKYVADNFTSDDVLVGAPAGTTIRIIYEIDNSLGLNFSHWELSTYYRYNFVTYRAPITNVYDEISVAEDTTYTSSVFTETVNGVTKKFVQLSFVSSGYYSMNAYASMDIKMWFTN